MQYTLSRRYVDTFRYSLVIVSFLVFVVDPESNLANGNLMHDALYEGQLVKGFPEYSSVRVMLC